MYNSAEVAERIKQFSKRKGLVVNDILIGCGLAKNTLVNMRAGSMPKADNLAKIAEQLDCSVDYLMGLTDDPAPSDDKNVPLTATEGDRIIREALKDTGLIGPDGALTDEGAMVVAKFLRNNADMLKGLLEK